ncbi:MAG: iron ABC transporter permease, partial [Candidatus Poribacteria bacterium]|nr:iron ABC transporter permease [Candidatus Poribacteria bacterium]
MAFVCADIAILKTRTLSHSTSLILLPIALFFLIFLIYPLLYTFKEAFWINSGFSLEYFELIITNETYREMLFNSFKMGISVTIMTTIFSLPIAYLLVRYNFKGRGILQGIILIPMIMPPFVGAVG